MKVALYDINAKQIGDFDLPESIFSAKISPKSVALAVRVYLSNRRRSHAKTKTRAQVAGTTKKMWSQKGTGRARHGSAKAPIFVGGGVTHGPRGDRNFDLKINRQIRRTALLSVLSMFARENRIAVVDKISRISPKTKDASKFISGLVAENKVLSPGSKIGLVTAKGLTNPKRAFGNLPQVNQLTLGSLNVYQLSNQNYLIMTPKAVNRLSQTYGRRS